MANLVIAVSMLSILVFLFSIKIAGAKKPALLNHVESCNSAGHQDHINFLHAIPLLLLPVLETDDNEQLSETERMNVTCSIYKVKGAL